MAPQLCAALIVVGLTAYAVLAGADFGGGFWDLTAGGTERGGPLRGMIQRSIAPVWEANHVWLIFVFVVIWTAFPVAFGSIVSTLYVPMFLAAIGIIFRGTAFALRGHATTIGEARALGATFALASVLTPFFLGTALGGVASGRVPVGNAAGDALTSWANPTSVTVGVLAVVTGAYLAAVYLAGDSEKAGQPELARAFRARALASGIVAGGVALAGLVVAHSDAPDLYDGLTGMPGILAVIASGVAGIATLALVRSARYGPARVCAAAAIACVAIGWAIAQSPFILPPSLTIDEAAASNATLTALLVTVAVGLLLLVPSLWYLYRLTLQGRLESAYEPLDERFRRVEAEAGEERG